MLYENNTKAHTVGCTDFHLQSYNKFRYQILRNMKLKNLCFIAIQEGARRHNIEIQELDIESDHIHLIAKLPLTMSASKALNLLKGYSSRLIFELCPMLKLRYPQGHLWSKGKFVQDL